MVRAHRVCERDRHQVVHLNPTMTKTDKEWSITPVVEWVLTDGRFLPDDVLVAEMGRRLVAEGAPIWRLHMSFQLLHPLLVSRAAVWTRDDDQLRHFSVRDEVRETDAYLGSPIQHLYEKREPLRQRLDAEAREVHEAYADLMDQGYTDYYGVPVRFTSKSGSIMVTASKDPAGFDDADISKLRRFSELVAPVAETIATRSLTRSLLDTYVGHRTGEKVLEGMIKRGDAEFIDAALWFSDLRNFTHYTETLPPRQILAMLNSYFEFVSAAVTARGGEILRFIGDAIADRVSRTRQRRAARRLPSRTRLGARRAGKPGDSQPPPAPRGRSGN